jgi:hypothetical protein
MPITNCQIFVQDRKDLIPFVELLSIERVSMEVVCIDLFGRDYNTRTPVLHTWMKITSTSIDDVKDILSDYSWFTDLIMPYKDGSEKTKNKEFYNANRKYFESGPKTFPVISKEKLVESLPYLYCYQLKALAMLYEIPKYQKMRRVKLLNTLKKYCGGQWPPPPTPPRCSEILPRHHSLAEWNNYVARIRDIMKRVNKNVKYADALLVANALKHNRFIREDQVIAYLKGDKA